MHEPTYRHALSSGWHLVKKHPILWALGILAILSGQYGMGNFVGQLVQSQYPAQDVSFFNIAAAGVPHWMTGLGLLWLSIIVCALIIAVALVSLAAQGALVTAAGEWYHTKESPDLSWAWHRSIRHFWAQLGVAVLRKGLLAMILVVFAYWSQKVLVAWDVGGSVAAIVLLTLGLLAGLIVSSLAIYTTGYILIEERRFLDALRRAWHMLHHHLLVSLETSLILFGLSLALTVGVLFVSTITLLPTALGFFITLATGASWVVSLGIVLTLCLFTLLIVLAGGLYNAYVTSVWMYLFMKMHHEGVTSRVLGWLKKLGKS